LDFIYDKRNQKFKPTDGFRSSYSLELPVISETNTLSNIYDYRIYTELYDENVTSLAFYLKTSNSITNDDIKLSERNFLPGSKLRGFEAGSVGPKDGNDYIGGNYASSVNLSTTLPQILQENQNVDFLIFLDAGNVWGVDYDSSLSDSNKIRSAAGLGVDWLTPIGPLNFTLAKPITKSSTDATETFRFNLGTSF
jgi:outer membrane protein insertion porin family